MLNTYCFRLVRVKVQSIDFRLGLTVPRNSKDIIVDHHQISLYTLCIFCCILHIVI